MAGELRRSREREESGAGWGVGWWILTVITVALLVRVLFLLQAREDLFFNGFSDSLYYHQWALHIFQGQIWSPVFYMSPLYPYLLAFFPTIFSSRLELILWFQVLLGSASCGLFYFLGRFAFGQTVVLLGRPDGCPLGGMWNKAIRLESWKREELKANQSPRW